LLSLGTKTFAVGSWSSITTPGLPGMPTASRCWS
jgi:hypothetical protein